MNKINYKTGDVQKVTEVGFEPTHLSILQLECSAIDRSAIQPLTVATPVD